MNGTQYTILVSEGVNLAFVKGVTETVGCPVEVKFARGEEPGWGRSGGIVLGLAVLLLGLVVVVLRRIVLLGRGVVLGLGLVLGLRSRRGRGLGQVRAAGDEAFLARSVRHSPALAAGIHVAV